MFSVLLLQVSYTLCTTLYTVYNDTVSLWEGCLLLGMLGSTSSAWCNPYSLSFTSPAVLGGTLDQTYFVSALLCESVVTAYPLC